MSKEVALKEIDINQKLLWMMNKDLKIYVAGHKGMVDRQFCSTKRALRI